MRDRRLVAAPTQEVGTEPHPSLVPPEREQKGMPLSPSFREGKQTDVTSWGLRL